MAQLNLVVGDVEGNTRRIVEAADKARDDLGADLIMVPELAVAIRRRIFCSTRDCGRRSRDPSSAFDRMSGASRSSRAIRNTSEIGSSIPPS
jgi:hypothetical protein